MNIVNNTIKLKDEETTLKLSLKRYFIDLLKQNFDRLLLVTRKGYWIYKTSMDDEAWEMLKEEDPISYEAIVNRNKKIIYTDRYFNKCYDDYKEFSGKKIWIFDDTMTHGSNLFFYFSYCSYYDNRDKHSGRKTEVVPCVYALSTEYPSEEANRKLLREFQRVIRDDSSISHVEEKAQDYLKLFNKSLKYKVRLSSEHLAKLCVFETKLFNENLCPLVIDLPILSRMKVEEKFTLPAYMNGGRGTGIEMTKEQFHRLTETSSEWIFNSNYFENNYIESCSSYFVNDVIDFGNLSSVIHDFIVKCKYKEKGDKIRAVFVPFAIFKSMTFSDIISAFFAMWKDTEHGNAVLKFIAENIKKEFKEKVRFDVDELMNSTDLKVLLKKNHNLCRNMYRSVIFYVSAYGGALFREYVFHRTGIEIDYDWDFMKESMPKEFIQSFRSLTREKKSYDDGLLNASVPEVVLPSQPLLMKNEQRQIATKERLEKAVRKQIILKRNDDGEDIAERIYIIEDIEQDLDCQFLFKNERERKTLITMILTDMLENSRIGNEIYIDNQKEIIYRGFKSGENSEVLFYRGMEFFYAFVYAFYYLAEEHYEQDYPKFIEKLEYYLRSKGYIGPLISEEDMRFYAEYFGSLAKNRRDEQILNKNFVLDRYWNEEDTSGIKQFIDQAWKDVQVWLN